jgi:hypothetical protein
VLFTKKVIGTLENDVPPSQMNLFMGAGDIDNDGRIDLVVCGVNGKLAWFRNSDNGTKFCRHDIDEVEARSTGGAVVDLTGNGYPDIIVAGDYRSPDIYWWENPAGTGGPWRRRLLLRTAGNKHHDLVVGDIKNTGERGIVVSNQYSEDNAGTTYYYVPIPADPHISPWPGVEIIATGKYESNPEYREPNRKQPEEGLAVADIDGDGRFELVAGTWWLKHIPELGWQEHRFARGYVTTKIAVADIDGDGRNEIVLSEGDPCIFGRRDGGKLAWFSRGTDPTDYWVEHQIDCGLLDGHTLSAGDICGNGNADLAVGECGTAFGVDKSVYTGRAPETLVYENDGTGGFTRHVIDRGTGSHDAMLLDLRGHGVPDIVSKPIFGPERWDVHVFYNESVALRDADRRGHA